MGENIDKIKSLLNVWHLFYLSIIYLAPYGRRDLIFCLASEHHFLRRIFEIFENWESSPEAKILGILDFKMYLEMLVFNVKNSK